jgi:hypothetical protein
MSGREARHAAQRLRGQSGFLQEVKMVAVIMMAALVALALYRYGATFAALKLILGVPLAFAGFAVAASLVANGGMGLSRRRTRRQVERAVRAGLAGNLPAMQAALEGIRTRDSVREQCQPFRADIVRETARPGPLRTSWLTLYDLVPHSEPGDENALLAEAGEWPREVQETVLTAAHTHRSRIALAEVFLRREEDPAVRRALLHLLFRMFPMAPDLPSPEWIGVLAPYDADLAGLEEAESARGAAGVAPQVRKYRQAIAAAKA